MKQLFIPFLIILHLTSFSQNDTGNYNFDYKVTVVEGNLNKDKLVDKVIVTQDTLNENAPYRLQVFFKETNGQSKLIVSSTKVIEAQYPGGRDGYITGNRFEDVTIDNGVLSINFEILRG